MQGNFTTMFRNQTRRARRASISLAPALWARQNFSRFDRPRRFVVSQPKFYYNPQFFDAPDLKTAADIILGHDSESTQSRWVRETDYLIRFWKEKQMIAQGSSGVDFGCGIGRLSR